MASLGYAQVAAHWRLVAVPAQQSAPPRGPTPFGDSRPERYDGHHRRVRDHVVGPLRPGRRGGRPRRTRRPAGVVTSWSVMRALQPWHHGEAEDRSARDRPTPTRSQRSSERSRARGHRPRTPSSAASRSRPVTPVALWAVSHVGPCRLQLHDRPGGRQARLVQRPRPSEPKPGDDATRLRLQQRGAAQRLGDAWSRTPTATGSAT